MFASAYPDFLHRCPHRRQRVRLSLRKAAKESRMEIAAATNLDRKSGVHGPKKLGRSPFELCLAVEQPSSFCPMYAGADLGHPSN